MCCSRLFYLSNNVWHIASSQYSPSDRYRTMSPKTHYASSLIPFSSFLRSLFFHFSYPSIYTNYGTLFSYRTRYDAMSEVSREFLVHFVKVIKANEFRAHFNICRLKVSPRNEPYPQAAF